MQVQLDGVWLVTLLVVSTRILAWSVIAPPIATAGVPHAIKVIFSVGLGLAMVPGAKAHAPAAEVAPLIGSLVEQVVIGAGLGFLTRLVFAAVEAAGSLIDISGGFALAAAYDPLQTTMTSIFGRFYALFCTTLIFATDAHLLIFQGFLRSFTAIPIDGHIDLAHLDSVLEKSVTALFVAALQIAGPLIIILFIADVSLGLLNRIAPQLNAFALSFPVKIGLTLVLAGLGFMLMPSTVVQLTDHANHLITQVFG